jgi:hypothetical protein
MGDVLTVSSAFAARGGLSYAARAVLADLRRAARGKCVCHIAATTSIEERLLYATLAGLLAKGLVRVSQVQENTEFAALLASALRKSSGDLAHDVDVWIDFFRHVGDSPQVPVYKVHITPRGIKELHARTMV